MKYEELKNKGVKICEKDQFAFGGYSGVKEYWEFNGNIYLHDFHTNLKSYTGSTSTNCIATIRDFGKYIAGFYLMEEEEWQKILDYCNDKLLEKRVNY